MSKNTDKRKSVEKTMSASSEILTNAPTEEGILMSEKRVTAYRKFKEWFMNDDPHRNCYVGLIRAVFISVRVGGNLYKLKKECVHHMYELGTGGTVFIPKTKTEQTVYMYSQLFDEIYEEMEQDEQSWNETL